MFTLNQKTVPKLTKIEELEKKSENAITVFKDTLETLMKVEEEAEQEKQLKAGEIAKIHLEINRIEERQKANGKFINKLKEFFE